MDKESIELHDQLLADLPDGDDESAHDPDTCPICKYKKKLEQLEEPEGRGEMEKTYDQSQLDATVAAAVAPLQAKIDAYESADLEKETASKIAAIETAADARVADAEAKVDLADVEAAAAKQKYDDLVAYLEQAKADQDEANEFEARKIERAEKVREVTNFSDEKIEERIADWAKLSAEDFDSRLAEWAELSVRSETEGDNKEKDVASTESPVLGAVRDQAGKASFWQSFKTVTDTASRYGVDTQSL